jgi:integrase
MATRKCLPTGIDVYVGKEKQSIRIFFMYRGVRCRETLDGLEVNDKNIKWAERHRSEIINTIAKGTFNYAEYFPNSKNARKLGMTKSKILIKDLAAEYMAIAEKNLQHSTMNQYRKDMKNHVIPNFGSINIQDLVPADIRNFISRNTKINRKTVQNVLIPLRNIITFALNDDLIESNPFDRIFIDKLLSKEQSESDYEVSPFDENERIRIIDVAHAQLKNMIQYAFYSGLRISELMALRWTDIDFEKEFAYVHRAFVDGKEKVTKTKAGTREVMMLPLAKDALLDQRQYTYLSSDHVFHNMVTGKPWASDQTLRSNWQRVLKLAKVVYRNPYQTRHTYASMLLSAGENPLWVAKQMGHVNTEMIFRVYGKWIKDNSAKTGYETIGDYSKLQNYSKSKLAS